VSAHRWHVLLLSGLIVRLLALPLAGTPDVDVWKTWSYGAAQDVSTMYGVGGNPPERGVVIWGARRTTVDYPPVALYGLALVGRAYRAFDPSFTDGRALTIAIKLTILLSEAVMAWCLFLLVGRWSEPGGRVAALLYWLNPAAILDGAVLGYLDPWAGALAMISIVALDRSRSAAGAGALILAVLTKAQAVLLVPFAGLLLLYREGRHRMKGAVIACAAAVGTIVVVLTPYARIGALENLRQGVGSLLRHDMLSGQAANLWWIVTWLLRASYAAPDLGVKAAWTMSVRILAVSRVIELGYPNPRPIGAIAAGSVIAWALWRVRRSPPELILAAGALAIHAYFVLEVQVHENHLYLALPLMAAAAAQIPKLRAPFYLLSGIFALNLFLFYGVGRPFPVPPRSFTLIDATVVLSFVNVAALLWHARRFALVTASEEAARPAAVHGNGHASHV
jgi:hypothetical protein